MSKKPSTDDPLTEPVIVDTPRAKPRGLDPELQVMAKIDRLLADLDDNQTARVIAWIVAKNTPEKPHEDVG